MMKSKTFEKALKDALNKEGVKNEWMEKHLIIDSLDLDKPKKREKKNGKNQWKNPNHF